MILMIHKLLSNPKNSGRNFTKEEQKWSSQSQAGELIIISPSFYICHLYASYLVLLEADEN